MPGPSLTGIPAGHMPAYGSQTNFFKLTVTNAAQRLVTIVGAANMPWVTDEMTTFSTSGPKLRPPFHLYLEVPQAAANPVYITWDNNTAPVVGGPGLELEPGTIYQFGNAGPTLIPYGGKTNGPYVVNSLSAIQLIATANTTLLAAFTD